MRLATHCSAREKPPKDKSGFRNPTGFAPGQSTRNVFCERSRYSRCRPRSATASVITPGRSISGIRSSSCDQEVLVAAQRLDEAAKTYQTAISLGAGADARRRLAEVHDALGRNAESVRERA